MTTVAPRPTTENTAPRQTKLLGATVVGLGLIVAVEANLHPNSYAVLETATGASRRLLIADLSRDDVTFPAEPHPYIKQTARVDYGVWDEVYALVPAPTVLAVALPVVLPVAA